MSTLIQELSDAKKEITRLQGIETNFSNFAAQIPGGPEGAAGFFASLAQVPGGAGGIPALVSEHASFKADVQRLQGELLTAQGDVKKVQGELTTLQGSFDQRVEDRAAEIVAATGNQPPAKADTPGASASADGKTSKTRSYDEHWSHYATLGAEAKNAYYRENSVAMNASR